MTHKSTDESHDEEDPLMSAAKKIYRNCLSRGDEAEEGVYRALRMNITDPVRN